MSLISGCTIKKQDHGYDFDGDDLKKLKINISMSEVTKIMGTPSAISSINKNIWYYISLKTKQVAILRPKVNNYKVLELKFSNNKLTHITLYTNDKLRKLDFKKWETPVRGSNEDLLQDFLYNIGRFNKALKK